MTTTRSWHDDDNGDPDEAEARTEDVAAAYSLLAKIQKRRKEIEKEIIEFDSKLGLDSAGFFRNRHARSNIRTRTRKD